MLHYMTEQACFQCICDLLKHKDVNYFLVPGELSLNAASFVLRDLAFRYAVRPTSSHPSATSTPDDSTHPPLIPSPYPSPLLNRLLYMYCHHHYYPPLPTTHHHHNLPLPTTYHRPPSPLPTTITTYLCNPPTHPSIYTPPLYRAAVFFTLHVISFTIISPNHLCATSLPAPAPLLSSNWPTDMLTVFLDSYTVTLNSYIRLHSTLSPFCL